MDSAVLTPALAEKVRKAFPSLILASASPNRLELLRDCGVNVITSPQNINEICGKSEPESVVETLSLKKLESYLSNEGRPSLPLIAVDTLVYFKSSLMGKPGDIEEAETFLRRLSGESHTVYSGLSLFISDEIITFSDTSKVTFRALSEKDIEAYLETQEWKGAAGGYRFQRTGYTLIEKIEGSRSNVVGLPLEKLLRRSEALRSAHGQA